MRLLKEETTFTAAKLLTPSPPQFFSFFSFCLSWEAHFVPFSAQIKVCPRAMVEPCWEKGLEPVFFLGFPSLDVIGQSFVVHAQKFTQWLTRLFGSTPEAVCQSCRLLLFDILYQLWDRVHYRQRIRPLCVCLLGSLLCFSVCVYICLTVVSPLTASAYIHA